MFHPLSGLFLNRSRVRLFGVRSSCPNHSRESLRSTKSNSGNLRWRIRTPKGIKDLSNEYMNSLGVLIKLVKFFIHHKSTRTDNKTNSIKRGVRNTSHKGTDRRAMKLIRDQYLKFHQKLVNSDVWRGYLPWNVYTLI